MVFENRTSQDKKRCMIKEKNPPCEWAARGGPWRFHQIAEGRIKALMIVQVVEHRLTGHRIGHSGRGHSRGLLNGAIAVLSQWSRGPPSSCDGWLVTTRNEGQLKQNFPRGHYTV
jgi:hypothetical protein